MRSNPAALRKARQLAGHSQGTLAEASGVSQQRISDLERDAIPILPATAHRLAATLDVRVQDIAIIEVTVP